MALSALLRDSIRVTESSCPVSSNICVLEQRNIVLCSNAKISEEIGQLLSVHVLLKCTNHKTLWESRSHYIMLETTNVQ